MEDGREKDPGGRSINFPDRKAVRKSLQGHLNEEGHKLYRRPAKVDHFTQVAVRTIRDLEHWLQEWHGAELQAVNFKKRDNDWLVVVKVVWRKKSKVAFIGGDSFADALINFTYALARKELQWKTDRYPTKLGIDKRVIIESEDGQ